MYTSEFIEKVEALPFVGKVRKHPIVENVGVYNDDGVGILLVSESEYLIVDTDRTAFESLRVNQKDELMNLVWQYISTPVDEREERKYFKLRRKDLFQNTNLDRYLTFHGDDVFSEGEFEGSVYKKDFVDWIEMTFDKEWVE